MQVSTRALAEPMTGDGVNSPSTSALLGQRFCREEALDSAFRDGLNTFRSQGRVFAVKAKLLRQEGEASA